MDLVLLRCRNGEVSIFTFPSLFVTFEVRFALVSQPLCNFVYVKCVACCTCCVQVNRKHAALSESHRWHAKNILDTLPRLCLAELQCYEKRLCNMPVWVLARVLIPYQDNRQIHQTTKQSPWNGPKPEQGWVRQKEFQLNHVRRQSSQCKLEAEQVQVACKQILVSQSSLNSKCSLNLSFEAGHGRVCSWQVRTASNFSATPATGGSLIKNGKCCFFCAWRQGG